MKTINSVSAAIDAIGTLSDVGRLYRPPISYQSVQQWVTRGQVPADRVVPLARAIEAQGLKVRYGALNPAFRAFDTDAA